MEATFFAYRARSHPWFLCAVLLFVGCLSICCRRVPASTELQGWISQLASERFESVRRAQTSIIRQGAVAIPSLETAFRGSTNEQQRALIAHVVGEIDANSYKALLLSVATESDVEACLKYPNGNALRRLGQGERSEVWRHLEGLRSSFSERGRTRVAELQQLIGR